MVQVQTFGRQCSEAMYVHARLIKCNMSVPHVKNYLAPVVFERRVLLGNVAWETKIFLHARRPIMVMSIYKRGFPIYVPL